MATKIRIATTPHKRAAKTAEEISADTTIIICDPGTKPETLPKLPDTNTTILAFDDVDYEDIKCGQPFSQQNAQQVLETMHATRQGIIITCPGGVSRSAAIACALWAANLAEATDEPFGRNSANAYTCPNRLVFDTCLNTWGTNIDKTWVDEMFERNIREHLKANADDEKTPTFKTNADDKQKSI